MSEYLEYVIMIGGKIKMKNLNDLMKQVKGDGEDVGPLRSVVSVTNS